MRRIQQDGFTIVELLITIVVIAILAAITVVAYNGIRDRADNSAVQGDLRQMGQQIEQYRVLHETSPGLSTMESGVLDGTRLQVTKGSYSEGYLERNNMAYCRDSDTTDAALVAWSRSGDGFYYSTATGTVQPFDYEPASYDTTCPRAGFSGDRRWLYSVAEAGGWRF